jgi:hypothetical protein
VDVLALSGLASVNDDAPSGRSPSTSIVETGMCLSSVARRGDLGDAARMTSSRAGRAPTGADDKVASSRRLAMLVASEQRCCAFLSFAITIDGRGVALEVSAPDGTEAIVASLFGEPA